MDLSTAQTSVVSSWLTSTCPFVTYVLFMAEIFLLQLFINRTHVRMVLFLSI